jgi:hypothetical protein
MLSLISGNSDLSGSNLLQTSEREAKMSVNTLEVEFLEVKTLIQEASARKEVLSEALAPHINNYFTALVKSTADTELRREYAEFNKVKRFEILNEDTVRFHAKNWSGQITHDVKLSQLLGS